MAYQQFFQKISLRIKYNLKNIERGPKMAFLQNSSFVKSLQKKYQQFLLKESNPAPYLYFLIFICFHFPFQSSQEQLGQMQFVIAVMIAAISNFNFVFMIAPFMNFSPLVALPMFLITLFFSNQKWKVYLLVLAVGDEAFHDSSQIYFLAIFSILICYQIHRKLIFKTISDNIQFFTGMAGISSYYSIIILSDYFGLKISLGIQIVMVIALASLSHSFICQHVKKLGQTNPEHIYCDEIMAHYLQIVEEEVDDLILFQGIIVSHSRQCNKTNCFCHSKKDNQQPSTFMWQLYSTAINKFHKRSSDSVLNERYVQFLLKNQQMIRALHFLSQWQPKGFFSFVAWQRARAKAQKIMLDANSSSHYQLQYQYALDYDHHYHWVAQEISKILKLKLLFWGEVNRETSRVLRMQKLGQEIITRMYDLNRLYSQIVKGHQQSLFVFDITALYAMYMLSTTNFKEYAQIIIKNTAKLLEDTHIIDNNASATYAIRTIVKQEKNHYIDHPQDNLKPVLETHMFARAQSPMACKLIIDSISSGLCKILYIPRTKLIGRELNTIIPIGYKEVHNIRLSRLLNFDHDNSYSEAASSRVIHRELKLPIRGADGQLVMGYVYVKMLLDLEDGLTFVSIVKLADDRTSHVLIDFSGKITEIEKGFNQQLIQHSQIKKYLKKIQESWNKQTDISQERFNLMMNANTYGITICSPLLDLFAQKQNLKIKFPPIHIEITNDDSNHHSRLNNKSNDAGQQIKHLEQAINSYHPQSSSSSSSGGLSVISIISNFTQNCSSPIYRLLKLAFLVATLISVISNFATFLVSDLPWDVTSPQANPLNDTMNMYAIHMLTAKALITLSDEQAFFSQVYQINQTRVSQYFGLTHYANDVMVFDDQLRTAYRDSIYNCFRSSSDLLRPILYEKFSRQMSINTQSTQTQKISYLQLMMVFLTDFDLMAHLQLDGITLSSSYNVDAYMIQNSTSLSTVISDAVKQREVISIAVHSAFIFIIMLLLIPLHLMLRKRLKLHEKIFDLMASIDAQQVASEIKSLHRICNILRNYDESNEIIKMNILQYEENIIHPKKSRGEILNNEMIRGLQKYGTTNSSDIKTSSYNSLMANSLNIDEKFSQVKTASDTSLKSIEKPTVSWKDRKQKHSVLSLVRKGFLSSVREWNKRKRSGELDLSGSMLDPSKKIDKEHLTIYLVVLSFILMIVASLFLQLSFNSSYLEGKDELLDIYNGQIIFQFDLLTARIFLLKEYAFSGYFVAFPDENMIISMLKQLPSYRYNDGSTLYSQIRPNCSINSSIASTFSKKYCELDYSEVILRGQFGLIYKELIEKRLLLDKKIGGLDTDMIMSNITQKLYYLESLNLRMEDLVLQKVKLMFDEIVQLGMSYGQERTTLLTVSFVWGVVCCVWGYLVILKMKKEYFNEVYMITFLNSQMIAKNKRVDSFLDSISKNKFP